LENNRHTAAAVSTVSGVAASTAHAAPADASWLPATPAGWNLVVDHAPRPATTVTKGVTERGETPGHGRRRQHTQVLDAT